MCHWYCEMTKQSPSGTLLLFDWLRITRRITAYGGLATLSHAQPIIEEKRAMERATKKAFQNERDICRSGVVNSNVINSKLSLNSKLLELLESCLPE